MRRRIQIFLTIAGVLSTTFITSPTVAQGQGAIVRFSNHSFVYGLPTGMPQTTGRKRRARRRRASTSQSNKPATDGTTTTTHQVSSSTAQGPLSQVMYELPLRKPGTGEQREQGLLTDVACDAKGVTFKITAGTRALRLWTPDLNRIHFATYTPDVSGEIVCGVRRPANMVVVVFRPAKTPNAKSDGTPISVEFVPKNFK